MKKGNVSLKQLIEKNKEELMQDNRALEKIERRLDEKYLGFKSSK